MKKSLFVTLALTSLVCSSIGCNSPYHRDRGAAMGGLAGAAIGAAIGEHNDNPLAGAAIGTVAGALTGAAIGDAVDADIARNNAIIEQQMGQRLAGAVTVPQAIAMSQSGLSPEVINTHIRANGVAQRPTTDDLIVMKNQGVSDVVVNAMQSQPPVTALPPGAVPSRPVVVEEHHYWGRPVPYRPAHFHHHHHRRHHGSRVGWGVSFTN